MTPVLFLPAGFLMFFGTNSLWRLFGFHAALAVAWLFVSLVVIAVGLYSLRFWSRLLYGMIELVAGAAILLAAINAYGAAQGREYVPIVGGGLFHTRPQGILQLSGPQIALFGMLVAVYVLVRGLDNVGEGLRDHPKWNARWQRWFRPPSRS
jgi:hypothetical protein